MGLPLQTPTSKGKKAMAGLFLLYRNRKFLWLALCALLAGPLAVGVKAQAIQAQTGSSSQPQQGQTAEDQKKDAEAKKKKAKKEEEEKEAKEHSEKRIKVKVVNEDKKKKPSETVGQQSVAPDKILYDRALFDIKKGHYTEGRLSLQALINTYPDSEYLAKAKLATADSYYKEGGISGLTQAIEEYKNFIIFFPFLDEAAYAQMQVGMAHFRMMEKPDRDTTQALDAEQEFQTFLLKYPKNPLVPEAEQHLRDVQEIIADGQYRVARFYYLKQDYPASAARLMDLVERYPLYSQTDQALWMLADVYERARKASRSEDDKNHWADLAGECYDRIVKNYPLSSLTGQAKERLKGMGMPVPAVDAEAMARMKKEQLYDKDHHEKVAFVKLPLELFKSSPSVAEASHFGLPTLTPPSDAISARTVLQQDAKGPDFNVANQELLTPTPPPPDADQGPPVESDTTSPDSTPQGTGVGVQIITPTTGTDATQTAPQPAASNPASAPQPASATGPSGVSNIDGSAITSAAPAATGTAPVNGSSTSAAPQPGANAQPAAQSSSGSSSSTAPDPDAKGKNGKNYKAPKLDDKSESSSKKKKGIKKIIPW
jgi:outer membrane protein assembly factor BamD